MVTFIAFAMVAMTALVNGLTPDIEQMANDVYIKTPNRGGQRLSGWQVVRPNNVKCDLIRPNIKKFGYCWQDENEKRNINTSKERRWVRDVIQQWEKCGGVKFVEESRCRQGPDFVTIHVGNFAPIINEIMDDPKSCRIDGFDMYLDFYTFGVNIDGFRKTEKIRQSNIQMYALHEFGHFLGFDHEHNRRDRLECYWQVDESQKGPNPYYANNIISPEYDLDSIMNYCRPNVHYKPWLSELDKRNVWKVYGGGNWDECTAATKPWQWYEGDGLFPNELAELQDEYKGVSKPPAGCVDKQNNCNNIKDRCNDESMKYWCPRTCNKC